MATINISLSEPMKVWIEAEAEAGRFNDAGDFVRDLIKREHERRTKIMAMQQLIDEALASGISDRTMDDIWHAALHRSGAAA